MIKRNTKINYFSLLKIATITFFKNWLNIVFSFIFPFIWIVICYYAWGKQVVYDNNNHHEILFAYTFSNTCLIPVLSLSLITIPYTFGYARLNNRYKNYATFGVKPIQYFSSYFLVAFCSYFVLENLLLLICNFGFLHGDEVNSLQYFLIWLVNLYTFISLFLIGCLIALIPKNQRSLSMLVQIVFIFNLLLSGVTVPAISFNNEMYMHPYNQADTWFKFIQYLSPIGCACRIGQNIMTPYLWNWETDWLSIFLPILYAYVCSLYVYKNFTWTKK